MSWPRVFSAAIVLLACVALSCAPAPSSLPTASPRGETCALAQLAAQIPSEVRTAIAAARQGDGPGSLAAMDRATLLGDQLRSRVESAGGGLAVTTRARFISVEAFAEQAHALFLGSAPGLPNEDLLVELDRGVTQVESLLSAIGCSSAG
jgi:hypothetical protein